MTGGTELTGWLADPVLIDGALPYQLRARLNVDNLQSGQALVLLRLIDPQDPRAIWWQREQVVDNSLTEVVTVGLPRLFNDPANLKAQAAIALLEEAEGQAQLVGVALQPEPVSVSVRGVAIAGGFKRIKDVSLFIAAVNNTYLVLKPKATMKVYDTDGKLVTEETRAILAGERSAAYFPYKPKLTAPGDFHLTVHVHSDGKELGSATYDFSVAGM
jgi:hypothetical protein